MHDIQTAPIERGNFLMLQTGAQLYTVRSYTQTIEDFICTIQKIADIGYKAVQLSAVSKQIKPEQIREICDRVAVIEGGVILEEGSTLEVFTNPKKPTTKDFVGSVVSDNLPQDALEHIELHDDWIAGTAPLVKLKFTGQATDEPVVAGLVRRFDLDVSILFGGIDYIQNTSVGRLIVILNGDPMKAQEGLDYIRTLPIESEVIGYVRANH